ncbi:MAG: rhomboid family intramembrane serine protease [Rubritalea sp.]|jgi:membrane associated rhomboid family serine protease
MKRVNQSNSYRPQRGAGGSRFAGAQVTKWLLIALVVLFLGDIVEMGDAAGRLMPYFALEGGAVHEVWRWVTYPFVNLTLGSWLFTLIIFFVFGRLAEQGIGSRRFAVMLIFTTLVGAAVYAVMSASGSTPLTGASGLGMAVLVAVAMMYPDQKVQLLIPPVPVKLKTLVFVLIGLLVVMAIAQRADPAVSLAHLSGVVVSFLCMKNQHWLNIGENLGYQKPVKRTAPKKRVARKDLKRGMKARTTLNMSVSKREAEVNRILDKVSAEGIGNLTEDERELLKFASKK